MQGGFHDITVPPSYWKSLHVPMSMPMPHLCMYNCGLFGEKTLSVRVAMSNKHSLNPDPVYTTHNVPVQLMHAGTVAVLAGHKQQSSWPEGRRVSACAVDMLLMLHAHGRCLWLWLRVAGFSHASSHKFTIHQRSSSLQLLLLL